MRLARLQLDYAPVLAFVYEGKYLPVSNILAEASGSIGALVSRTDWANLIQAAQNASGWQPLEGVSFLPACDPTSRIFCVGKNYADHAREMGMTTPGGPAAPDIFVRFPQSFVGHGGTVEYPKSETTFDYEGELAVVIGKAGRAISREAAKGHVFGLTCANDGSLRRLQKRTSQFTLGKNFDRSGALGPTITPLTQLPASLKLDLRTSVNGAAKQNGNTADMIFDIETVIATISAMTELQPGDIVLTGTPSGVGAGRTPPEFLNHGDRIDIEIDGLESLSVTVAAVDVLPQ
ncbi:fumarylacetoacetate hydrolase family protein [Kordiimonas sp.]|uniref:fumarylacetoacetate hydrolase family protein n=1 Tax=Kordiimonas sp. TaxID=1970157 RepID=UPI003A9301F2